MRNQKSMIQVVYVLTTAAFIIFAISFLSVSRVSAQDMPGVDLYGGDYTNFVVNGSDPFQECVSACQADPQCMALTLVPAGVTGPSPVCWLKDKHYQVQSNGIMHSWTKPMYYSSVPNVDLWGMDYRSLMFTNTSQNAMDCRNECQNDPQCVSFTFVEGGMCYLKNGVPQPTNKPGCHSGVIYERAGITPSGTAGVPSQPAGQPQPGSPEALHMADIDLPGQDIANFDVPTNDYRVCLRACQQSPLCRSYSFVDPGVQGQFAHCWLKDGIPGMVADYQVDSGIVR